VEDQNGGADLLVVPDPSIFLSNYTKDLAFTGLKEKSGEQAGKLAWRVFGQMLLSYVGYCWANGSFTGNRQRRRSFIVFDNATDEVV